MDAAHDEAAKPTQSHNATITESSALQTSEISVAEDVQQHPLLEANKSEGNKDDPSVVSIVHKPERDTLVCK